ncbi:MAG: preprotein translocase subunit SecY [Clostridiales bacterium]|nr:preprotein translocase subunit SecY [Clostridiales bacterium]
MLSSLAAAWKIKELRQKILFTLMIFVVFRAGAHVPVPGIDVTQIGALLGSDIWGYLDVISGGALKQFTVFAMGIVPYINASIIVQLLTMVVPYFEKLQKEGPEGRKKMTQIIRYGTVVLAFAQAIGITFVLRTAVLPEHQNFFSYLAIVITLTAGTAFLMWLGELITEKGIGNGISLIIFAGIVSRVPAGARTVYEYIVNKTMHPLLLLLFGVLALLVIAGIVYIQEGQRRIPVQYAKRVVGRKVYGGQSTHIPMKINQAGVIPIIFASSFLILPQTIAKFFAGENTVGVAAWFVKIFGFQHPVYLVIYTIFIFLFTYFYTAATFNTGDVADNLKKHGGFVPGLRPGKPTAEFLDRILSRVTFAGAAFLAAIALMPNLASAITGQSIGFGGTSLLIVVGVALETMKQIESHLLMRHYQGFMR